MDENLSDFEDIKPQLFTCDECSVSYTSQPHLAHHIETQHSLSLKINNVWSVNEQFDATNHSNIKNEPDQESEVNSDHGAYKCSDCLMFFSHKYIFDQHTKLLHEPTRSHKCDQCPKSFATAQNFNSHKKAHSGMFHGCPYCTTHFFKRGDLDKHIGLHTNPRPFTCDSCSKHFVSKADLRKHNVHCGSTTKDSFRCNKCPKSFNSLRFLARHNKLHLARKYACPYCSKLYKYSGTLSEHIKIHYIDLVCAICSKTFKEENSFRDHVKICDCDVPQKVNEDCLDSNWFECCSTSFVTKDELEEHERLAHNGPKKCNKCPMSFQTAHWLTKHKLMTHVNKKFVCPYCSKIFKRKDEFKNHINILHVKREVYTCHICGRNFVKESSLQNHLKSSTHRKCAGGKFQCKLCLSKFRSLRSLIVHRRTHSRNLTCPHCGKAFANRTVFYKMHTFQCQNSGVAENNDLELDSMPVTIDSKIGINIFHSS